MLITLRNTPHRGWVPLDEDFKRDVRWFMAFLPDYNGVHLLDSNLRTSHHVELDSCLTGCGAIFGDQYYHNPYPDFITQQNRPICHLELLNIVIAAKIWCTEWRHRTVPVFCDNMTAVQVLRNGRTREIWLLSATYDFELTVSHKPGADMLAADALIRAHLRPEFTSQLHKLDLNPLNRVYVPHQYFDLNAIL